MHKEDNLAYQLPPDNNVMVAGEVLSLAEMEKVFFLYKLSPDPSFIASTLGLPVSKVDAIINSANFELVIAEYLGNYMSGSIGEKPEHLALRYSDFLRDIFVHMRISVSLYVRQRAEEGKPIEPKHLFINQIRELMKLEFSIHGIPVDLRGILHKGKTSEDKTDKELIESLDSLNDTLQDATGKTFNPLKFSDAKFEDVKDDSVPDTKDDIAIEDEEPSGPGMPLMFNDGEDEDVEY